ncbi:MAG: DUF3306 domain-containing protein, partial [Acetobacteraceae bacterium]
APIDAKPEALPAEPEDEFDLTSLPPIESLTTESDFKAFLHRKVPLELRSAALRRAWSLDPAIRDFIGPADYAWDFNAPDGVPGFALDLGGDAMKLLSHALGLDAPTPKPEAEAPDEAVAVAEAPAPEAPSDPPSLAISEAAPEAATPPDPPLERPRRHGSALPV